MLISFEVENFRSFNKRQVFHTVQRNFKRFPNHVYSYNDDLKLLKVTGIYGGNASGKTNLFCALYFVKMMVQEIDFINSLQGRKLFSPYRFDRDSEFKDSSFVVDFISNKTIYSYSLRINFKMRIITYEMLSKFDSNLKKEELIFERTTNEKRETKLNIPSLTSNVDLLESFSRIVPQQMTILNYNIFSINHLSDAREWFVDKVRFQFPTFDSSELTYILHLKKENLTLANRIMAISKTGIDHFTIEKIPIEQYLGAEKKDEIERITSILHEKKFHTFADSAGVFCTAIIDEKNRIIVLKLKTVHKDKNGNEIYFDLDQESRGSVALTHLLPAFIQSYGEGVNYFIDEIGASLHPILIKEILYQYLSFNINNAKGQIIYNTHEDFIMDATLIRQDEIWLVDMPENETIIFPLSDIPNVRFDLDLRRNYLNGRFGGVPYDKKPDNLIFEDKKYE